MKTYRRDGQRTRLYGAEHVLFEGCAPDLPPSAGVEPARRFISRIMSSKWMRKHYPAAVVGWWPAGKVGVMGGNGNNADSRRIMVTLYGRRRRWILLHELAHTIESRIYPSGTTAPHGREFANIYLALMRKWMGEVQYKDLRETFRVNRVRYNLPRKATTKRAGNPAALAAYRERIRVERAARPSLDQGSNNGS